jgi:precorrin-2/cobalt-factor-2 C20-methyltransferase
MKHLTVVGLGPGDPELLTLKGLHAIQAAQLIFAPRSRADEPSRALPIVERWIERERQEAVLLTLPMQRDAERTAAIYRELAVHIAAQLSAAAARRGGEVRAVYLLLGDPLLYGTFTYLWGELLAAAPSLSIEVIPGITSFAAAAARAGLPLAGHDERVTIVPANVQLDRQQLGRLCAAFTTVVILKAGRELPRLIAALDKLDLLEQSLYAEYVGMPNERIVRDVGSLRTYRGPYLSLLIIRRNSEVQP